MEELQKFYHSKKWESFRKVFIAEHTSDDGFVYCAICGKPILKAYDLIVHHKNELSEENVADATVSLNPDNVECVHFKCHNILHNRFSEGHGATFTRAVKKQVFIVYGSPCSGKSTWVSENATANDLIVDLDSIWQMISINNRYEKPAALKSVVFELRDKMYDIIKYRSGKWYTAYVITGGAMKGDRDRLVQRIGADDLIFIDTPYAECIKRCGNRGDKVDEWISYVNDWFNTFQPDPEEE